MLKYTIILLSLIFISCTENVNDPPPNVQSGLNEILVKQDNKLFSYSLESKNEKLVFDAQDKSIFSFDYNNETGNIFLILFESDEYIHMNYTSLVKLSKDGEFIEIMKDSSREGEGFWSFDNINVSKDERYLALDGILYEGEFFSVYDLQNNIFIDFDGRQYTEFIDFFLWAPDGNAIYVKSHSYLVYYDLLNKSITMLDSPNIRDYLSEEYLLKNGYVGKRFDYNSAIEIDYPKYVNWNPSGNKFIYINENELFLYDIENTSQEQLLKIENYVSYFGKYISVFWDQSANLQVLYPYFTENDLIVAFDSTIMSTVTTLNDSLDYQIEKSYSISYFRPNWNNRFYSWDKYYFRKEISAEKFHLAEFDFHMWYYALWMTPEFWFLVTTMDSDNYNKDEFIEKFNTLLTKYSSDYEYFKELKYPAGLEEKRSLYEKRHQIDIQFQELFLHFIETSDTTNFKDDVYDLLKEEDKSVVDSIFMMINDTNIILNTRLIHFYASIHNNFLNYYGKIMAKDIDLLRRQYLIEILEDDWLYKINKLYTKEYLRNKVYSY